MLKENRTAMHKIESFESSTFYRFLNVVKAHLVDTNSRKLSDWRKIKQIRTKRCENSILGVQLIRGDGRAIIDYTWSQDDGEWEVAKLPDQREVIGFKWSK